MTDRKYLSPSEVIFRGFPDAMRNAARAVVRVRSIDNRAGDLPHSRMVRYIVERIAQRITSDLATQTDHQQEQQRRRNIRRSLTTETAASEGSNQAETEDDIFGSMFGSGSTIIEVNEPESPTLPTIRPQNIAFVLVDDDARLRTRVFPRTFYCRDCGHFMAINPNSPPTSLQCPCCKQSTLRQEPIVFGCARCASIRELVPPGSVINPDTKSRARQRLDDFLGSSIPCPDCGKGHVHLDKQRSNQVSLWEWKCNSCSFREEVDEVCLNCALPQVGEERGSIISMRSIPATAPGALSPLTEVQMFIGEEPLNPATLYVTARNEGAKWTDYFELEKAYESRALSLDDKAIIVDACIQNAYLLQNVHVVTTVFGYRAGRVLANRTTPVEPQEQLAVFFRDPERIVEYVCYGMQTHGAALVIEFNQEQIVQRFAAANAGWPNSSYQQVIRDERAIIANSPLRDLVAPDGSRPLLFSAMHAVEHALLTNAQRLLGSEVLGSMCFFEQGIILLYEREDVGRGGVVQLVNNGSGLLDLIKACRDHVLGCAQGCKDSCPSCIYVSDALCNYRSEDTGRAWLPSNVLLSRTGARRILASEIE